VEIDTPSRKTEFNSAISQYTEFEYVASKQKDVPVALAFTDKYISPDSWNAVDFAAELCPVNRNNHIIYLSGRNTPLSEIEETLSACGSYGFNNIIPVSGDGLPGENAEKTRRRNFTDSTHVTKILGTLPEKEFYHGTVVNPFKYTQGDIYPQYFKLIKKLKLGAGFIVTQAGWDMYKLQELRWHLSFRGLHYPSIARLMLLPPEKVKLISRGKIPGIHISPDFQKILETEVKYSHRQFEAAQWRRLQIQAAGCRLLGYSAVQISGIQTPAQMLTACRRIKEAIEEFKTFEDWRTAYTQNLARAEMAPYPHRFYMYDKLFTRAHLDFSPKMNESRERKCSTAEKIRYEVCRFLFPYSNKQAPREHVLLKKLFVNCKGCSYCRLPLFHYICPENCPKGLANGPCGNTRADGSCEFGLTECIHNKRMRLAVWLNEIDRLEEQYIEYTPPDKLKVNPGYHY
jgi:methylenetetrahydrofolate reductase (NADPH)